MLDTPPVSNLAAFIFIDTDYNNGFWGKRLRNVFFAVLENFVGSSNLSRRSNDMHLLAAFSRISLGCCRV